MVQKTIWMLCLTIGTSLTSCKRDNGNEPIQKAEFIYKNLFDDTVRFEIYKSMNTSSLEYLLNQGDSLTFYFTGSPGTYPFTGNEISNRTGDSVIIRFKDNRCVAYSLDQSSGTYGGNGVFDLKEYDNYSQDLVNQKSYTLRYTIDSTDYKKAVPCK